MLLITVCNFAYCDQLVQFPPLHMARYRKRLLEKIADTAGQEESGEPIFRQTRHQPYNLWRDYDETAHEINTHG